MKTLFAKYNSERLPKYQIVTKMCLDDSGKKIAIKEPLCEEAKEHIDAIYRNYELLKSKYNLHLVQPLRLNNGIAFDMAEGVSLESILLDAVNSNDKERFKKYFNLFLALVDGMVTKRSVIFEPSESFKSVFGDCQIEEPTDVIELANIDLIFGNVFVDDSSRLTLIDYEWVFDFEVPKEFIIWRSLFSFSVYHSKNLLYFIDDFLIDNEIFSNMDKCFGLFVHGKDKKHLLTESVKKNVVIFGEENKKSLTAKNDYLIQLFVDQAIGFSEESSLKLPVSQSSETQDFFFDLSDQRALKALRLDPLNDSCVIEIDRLQLVNKDGSQIDLMPFMQSNDRIHHGNAYFFDTEDSNIWFPNFDFSQFEEKIKGVRVNFRYVHIGQSAIAVTLEQLAKDFQYKSESLLQTQGELAQTQGELAQTQGELAQTQGELAQTQGELAQTQNEFNSIINSKSWKMTNILRKLASILKRMPREKSDKRVLEASKYFDKKYYLSTYPDVKEAGIDPVEHYCEYGWKEGRNPSKIFNTSYYLNNNFDVKDVGVNPLIHYVRFGKKEGRSADENEQKNIIFLLAQNPKLIFSLFRHIKNKGFLSAFNRVKNYSILKGNGSLKVYSYTVPVFSKRISLDNDSFVYKPLISIIMPVYNVDPKWLSLAIKSIENQWYENWELCIADDKSTNVETIGYLTNINNSKIKIKFLENNLNISGASNEALSMATGEYVALMDNDDELTPDALYEVVKAINETDSDFIYSDEDKLEMDGSFTEPHFKPDFSPDMFLSQNYISHLSVIKKSLVDKVGGFTVGLEGAQDYDLYLKLFENTDKIHHIQKVLYHWRKIPGSTAAEFGEKSYAQNAGVQALQNAINRRNIDAKVENGKYPGTYRVKYSIKNNPLVSIIIPFKDKPELLTMCIESILTKSTYNNFEVIGVSNNSTEKATFDEMVRLEKLDSRIKLYEYNVPFNYSQINNHAVEKYAKGEHIVFLNNDIEIISHEWIESMLEHSQRDVIGCVGAKLYYPDHTIQHAGITIGVLKLAGHNFKHLDRNVPAYFGRESVIYNVSAVTAACLMVKTKIFKELKGLNEESLKIAFNDVDFCLRVQEKGYKNIFTPYCEAYHHESISRGAEDNPEKVARFNSEVEYMQERHKEILEKGDPYYNRNLTLDREDFSLR